MVNFMRFYPSIFSILILSSALCNARAEQSTESTNISQPIQGKQTAHENAVEHDSEEKRDYEQLATDYKQLIADYKAYAASLSQNLRDEITEYRKKVAQLNEQKALLYRQLSNEAQEYLKRIQEFKKKAPLAKKPGFKSRSRARSENTRS